MSFIPPGPFNTFWRKVFLTSPKTRSWLEDNDICTSLVISSHSAFQNQQISKKGVKHTEGAERKGEGKT